jgi:hypothetical protein
LGRGGGDTDIPKNAAMPASKTIILVFWASVWCEKLVFYASKIPQLNIKMPAYWQLAISFGKMPGFWHI